MKLSVEKRIISGKNVKNLLKIGMVPAVIYGKHVEKSYSVKFDKKTFLKLYREAWNTTPITLEWDGIKELVLIHNMQVHPVKDNLIHVDFMAVKVDEVVRAEVPLVAEWDEALTKRWLGYNLVLNSISIEALPTDIPHKIIINLDKLENDGDNIMINALDISDKVTVLNSEDTAVVVSFDLNKAASASEEEEAEADVSSEDAAWGAGDEEESEEKSE